MSGIEVAGLVLGAFPVLLQGLQAYKQGITRFRRCGPQLERLKRELQVEQHEFQKACDQYDELLESGTTVDLNFTELFEKTVAHIQESVEELGVQLRIELGPKSKVYYTY